MGIKINQNIFSMLVQRNLSRSTQKLEKSYENLSSGERINRSADDPAGMATSEQLRYEIQGLRQNQQNVTGTLSLLGTAESQMGTMVSLLQRGRELSVQAGNGTLSPTDRQAIQAELTEIFDELNRVASTARVNDQYLLNGQLQNVSVQVGTRSTETIPISLADYRVNVLGMRSEKTSDQPVGTTALAAGTVSINGIAVPAAKSDGISTTQAAASALAKAAAINEIESQTGVHAEALATTQAAVGPLQAVNLDGTTRSFKINGVNISPVTVQAGDSGGALVQAINSRTGLTGVTASVDGSGALQLTAADGRNIEVTAQGSIGDELGLRVGDGDVSLVATGRVMLTSVRTFTLNDPTAALGMTTPVQQINPDAATALSNINVANVDAASNALRSIDAALAQLGDGLSTIGAVNNRLDGLSETLAKRVEDLSTTDSRIRDADYAFETAQMTQSQILQEAAIAMLAQANVTPRKALELLQG